MVQHDMTTASQQGLPYAQALLQSNFLESNFAGILPEACVPINSKKNNKILYTFQRQSNLV